MKKFFRSAIAIILAISMMPLCFAIEPEPQGGSNGQHFRTTLLYVIFMVCPYIKAMLMKMDLLTVRKS